MRWETTIWMSAALVVATSALQFAIEEDLLADHNQRRTTPPAAKDSVDIVYNLSEENYSNETGAVSDGQLLTTNSYTRTTNSGNSSEKILSNEIYDLFHPDSKASDELEGEENDEGGGVEGDNNEANEEEGGAGGDNQDGDNGEPPGGADDNNETISNGTENGAAGDNNDRPIIAVPEGGPGLGNDVESIIPEPESGPDGGNGSEPILPPPEDGAGGDYNGDASNEPEAEGSNEAVGEGTIIATTTGPVRGHAWQDNANIISYIDIQYGTFRSPFEAPVPPAPWERVHDVKDHTKRCPQLQDDRYVGDTDCLTLSIFTPSNVVNASVLVHIHEGNFTNGSANPAIYGPEYLVPNGIILVLPNYRLGALGFLCLQNASAPGNAALKDLSLALSWIKANIVQFGGNPENIAVSGDGTAGALVGYLALSPMSKDNVTKVITESGSVLSHWALDRNPIVSATGLANRINGFQSWQGIDTSILVRAAKDVVLRPCIERASDSGVNFMVETPWTMIRSQTTNITFMMGSAKYAGVHEYMMHTESSIQQINNDVGLLLPNDLRFETNEERSRVGNKVKTQYFGEPAITVSDVTRLTLYFTDAEYLGPGIRTARPLVSSGATVYLYEFSFVGSLNRELQAINQPVDGAVKGDIIGYLFTQDGVVPAEDTNERRMIDQLIELWTSFLKTGIPSAENLVWNKLENVSASNEAWLSIEQELSMRTGLHLDRLSLWTDIYNQHFIERNLAFGTTASVYTVLIIQFVIFIGFFRSAPHLF